MKSTQPGGGTSRVEVSSISSHGIWLFLGDREAFLPFEDFPWFREAPVASVLNVERPQPHHLYWPDLDIDLHLDSIDHPEHYPLVSKERPRGEYRARNGASGSIQPHRKRTRRTRGG